MGPGWARSSARWSGTTIPLPGREPSTPRALSIAAWPRTSRLGFTATTQHWPPSRLFLWRRSLIPPLLGMLLSVPITDLVPMLGLPALTAPFVLATWLVLAFGWLDGRLFAEQAITAAVNVGHAAVGDATICSLLDLSFGVSPMNLSPQERDKLLIFVAAQVARATQETRPETECPRGDGPDHGRAHGDGS